MKGHSDQPTVRPRAAIYARLSVDRDAEKIGIDAQLRDARTLADRLGFDVTREYVDRNLTAADKLKTRPQYDQFHADGKTGLYDFALVWDLDRLSRQPRQIEDWIDLAEDEQRYLITFNEGIDLRTETGKTYARIKAAVQRQEVQQMRIRAKRNALARAELGRWHGGRVPYGYRANEKNLLPYPPEVKMIHEAARRLLDDREPLNSICQDWNANGKLTQSGTYWRSINLRRMLLNRTMLGETRMGIVGWEPIIDQRTFDRMTALLTEPGRRKNQTAKVPGGRMAMGGGLTVCGRCGKPLRLATKAGEIERLTCQRTAHGPDPENHPRVAREVTRGGKKIMVEQDTGRVAIRHDVLEEYVWGQVIARLEATPRWHERMSETDPAINARIDVLERERSDLREQRARVKRAFVAGIIETEREAQQEIERIDAELDDIESKINDLLGRPLLAEAFKDGIDWRTWAPGRRRTALRGFIDRVIVNDTPTRGSRISPPFRGESREAYEDRKRKQMRVMTAQRVEIVWKQAAG